MHSRDQARARRVTIYAMSLLLLASFSYVIYWGLTVKAPSYLFDDAECTEACWRGLRPGQTTEEDLAAFLDEGFEYTTSSEQGRDAYVAKQRLNLRTQIDLRAYTVDDVLTLLEVESNRNFDMTLGRLFNDLGAPEAIDLAPAVDDSSAETSPIVIYYPHLGFAFQAATTSESDDEICLTEDDPVTAFSIAPIGTMAEFLALRASDSADNAASESSAPRLSFWTGFSCVNPSEATPYAPPDAVPPS